MEIHYAHIEDGIVINIEVVTDEFVELNTERYNSHVKVDALCGRKYTYSGDLGYGSSGTFTPPKPYLSWILRNNVWEAPVKKPEGEFYWDELKNEWIAIDL